MFNNRVYKGRFPIAVTEKRCPLGGYIPPSTYEKYSTPITDLREELDEDELLLIELETPVKVINADKSVTEIKYVRHKGQEVPQTKVNAHYYFLSPHSDGFNINSENLKHCINLCLENPKWSLSIQQHKLWNIL